MAQRPTRKTGIQKPRLQDQNLQRVLDAIIERLEVIDGLRGDALDQAVTYRALQDSGFDIAGTRLVGGGVGTPVVTPPATGDGPTPGPTTPPTALAVNETYLALLISWTSPPFNLQHIEVWRSAEDNLSTAVMIGTTVSTRFMDYVGAEQSYYYWARAVATDGTKSAYNATAGTLGQTGIDPGNLSIDPRFFALFDGTGTELPFLTDGAGTIGIDGDLIVDGTIRALSLIAASIGAREINAEEINAVLATFDTVLASVFATGEAPSYRVELENIPGTAYPLWYGSGAKGPTTGRFFMDLLGNVYIKGLLDAGMIKQSFFAPATTDNNSFRVACEYPANYSGGEYTGKAAHLSPTLGTTQATAYVLHSRTYDPTYPGFRLTPYTSPTVTFYGPASTSNVQYGRLGTNSELLTISLNVAVTSFMDGTAPWSSSEAPLTWIFPLWAFFEVHVEYRYSGDAAWSHLTILPVQSLGSGATGFNFTVCTRTTPFDNIAFRYRVVLTEARNPNSYTGFNPISLQNELTYIQLETSSLSITTPNFGYADNTLTLLTPAEVDDTPLTPEQLEQKAGIVQLPGGGGLIA